MRRLSPFPPLFATTAVVVGLAACSGGCSSGPMTVPVDGGMDVGPTPGLTLVRERKLSKLLGDTVNHYEASGVLLRGGRLFVAFDDLSSLGVVTPDLLTGSFVGGGADFTQVEGLADCPNRPSMLCAAKETASATDPRGEVLVLDENAAVQAVLPSDVVFTNPNRGFEGLAAVEGPQGGRLLALCEGNHCQDDVDDVGHGQLHVLAESAGMLTSEAVLSLPERARFRDYADIAVRSRGDGTYSVVVVSQMSSALWSGVLTTSPWGFADEGVVWGFPRTNDGKAQYCNVEGVTYLDATHLVLTSDKSDGTDPCNDKDESVHVFRLL